MVKSRILVSLVALCMASMVWSEDAKRTLPPAHTKAKLICHDCHGKENPAKAAVADESCMVCHGDYPAMAVYTKHLKPNPHKPPTIADHPAFACTECHSQHKPQQVKCMECHEDFKMSTHQ